MSGLLAPKLKFGIIHLGIILLVLIGLTVATSLALFAQNNTGRPFDLSILIGTKPSPCGIYGDLNNKEGKINRGDLTVINNYLDGHGQLPNRPDNDALKRADVDGDGEVTQADADLISQYLSGQIATFPVCGEATTPQTRKRATCDFLDKSHAFSSTKLGGGGYVTDQNAQQILARPRDWTKKVGPLFTTSKWGLQTVDKSAEQGGNLDVNADGYVNATDADLIRQFLAYKFLNFPACPPPPPASDIVYPRKTDPNPHYYDDVTSRCWPYGEGFDAADAQTAAYFKTIEGTDTLLPPNFQNPLLDLNADGRIDGHDLLVLKHPNWPVCRKENYHPDALLVAHAYAPKDCDHHGDINGDGRVTYDDVKTVFQIVRGEITLTDQQQKMADTDGNGRVDILDAMLIYRGSLTANTTYTLKHWPVCGMPDLITPPPADSALFKMPPCRHLGDVNRDGQIDDYDAVHIFEYASGFTGGPQYGPNFEDVSDINGDGVAGVTDGRLIRQYLAGTIDTFAACANTGFPPADNRSH